MCSSGRRTDCLFSTLTVRTCVVVFPLRSIPRPHHTDPRSLTPSPSSNERIEGTPRVTGGVVWSPGCVRDVHDPRRVRYGQGWVTCPSERREGVPVKRVGTVTLGSPGADRSGRYVEEFTEVGVCDLFLVVVLTPHVPKDKETGNPLGFIKGLPGVPLVPVSLSPPSSPSVGPLSSTFVGLGPPRPVSLRSPFSPPRLGR